MSLKHRPVERTLLDMPGLEALPLEEMAAAVAGDLRAWLRIDRALAAIFAARADIVAEILARQERAPAPATNALDVDEVARRSGMSKQWLYREARAGRLPFARRLGRRLMFDERGLARWLERRPR